MKYSIHIHNFQKRIPVSSVFLKKVVLNILERQGIHKADLSIVMMTDRGIHALNKKFLKHDFPTDVITFDLSEGELSRKERFQTRVIDGEIYVSAVTAARQARELARPAQQELVLYIVHGILHLLGYDDHTAADRKKMREKEKEILFEIGDLSDENARKGKSENPKKG